jgi:hypothetical protein
MKLKKEAIFEQLEDEGYLYNSENDNLFSLNASGILIMNLIKDNKDVSEIQKKLVEEFDVDDKIASQDLNEFIDSLKKQGFLDD